MALKQDILRAALKLAAKHGLKNLTRLQIATAADVGNGTVTYHFKDMRGMLSAIVTEAIAQKDLVVLAQAIAERHPLALKMPDDLKARAARHLAHAV